MKSTISLAESIIEKKSLIKIKYLSPIESWLKGVKFTENGSYQGSILSIGFPLDKNGEYLRTGLNDKEAEDLEKACYLEPNDLKNPKSQFLKEYEFRFDKSKEQILDLSNPIDKLKYICLLANNTKVVFNLKEKITKPLAEILIMDDETEATQNISKFELKAELYKTVESLTSSDFRNILLSLGERVDSLSEIQISAKVKELAESEPISMLKLIKEVKSDPIKAEFNEMVHFQVLTYKAGYYAVNDTNADILGRNAEDCINFMRDPKNKDLVNLLKMRLKEFKSKK